MVDALDSAEMRFEGVEPAATGRPTYHPSVLLKLYIYGYLNRVQSSRQLEREAGRNVEVMRLLGRLAPDHKTIPAHIGPIMFGAYARHPDQTTATGLNAKICFEAD